jgi:hypothetical protein
VTSTLSNAEVSRWRAAVGDSRIGEPVAGADLTGLPPDLRAFYQVVGEVSLPDVENGYWIHRPPEPGVDNGRPYVLSDGRPIVVFGSDGGGALFALCGSAVLRLAGGAEVGGVYDEDGATVVAGDLREFLALLLRGAGRP